jgi:hypothetical protein
VSEKTTARKKVDDKPEVKADPQVTPPTEATTQRGPLSPAQHEDDGWGDTPVQMRG